MDIWDYKYRIFFVDKIKDKFKEFYDKLDNEEKQVYKKIYDFYTSFYSFGVLYNLVVEDFTNASSYINKALLNIDKVINIDNKLVKLYLNKIEKEINDDKIKQDLIYIINKAKKG